MLANAPRRSARRADSPDTVPSRGWPAPFWRACVSAATDAARVLIVIATSGAFVWIVAANAAARKEAAARAASALPPVLPLAGAARVLLAPGCVLAPVALFVVIVPALAATLALLGVDPAQLGVVAVLAAAIVLVTPPAGLLLFIIASQSAATWPRSCRSRARWCCGSRRACVFGA